MWEKEYNYQTVRIQSEVQVYVAQEEHLIVEFVDVQIQFNNMTLPDLSGSCAGSSLSISCIYDRAGNRVPVKVTMWLSEQWPGSGQYKYIYARIC